MDATQRRGRRAGALVAMTAAVELSFDPMLAVGGVSLRWDALALVVVLLISIGVWVLRLRDELGDALRFEDVWFVLLAAIPGAVVGGRLFHVLDYADSYLAAPLTTLDLGHGSSSLVGAVIGGALSAAYICRLLGGSIGRWADAAAVPMLLAIGLGKLAIMLGGAGQGLASDGAMGVSFTGPGPWRSIDAADPAWPSQALEGLWALLGIPVVLGLERLVGRKGRDFFKRRGFEIRIEEIGIFQRVKYADAKRIAEAAIDAFTSGRVSKVFIVYNEFKSVMQQRVVTEQLLPIPKSAVSGSDARAPQGRSADLQVGQTKAPVQGDIDYIYEPDPAQILGELLPKHIEIQVYRALLESAAAEHAARMTAMDAATKNSGEIIDTLTLYMNKVRQAAITREIIEVVSGAQAL
jgi:prolipoprotein diacylglyceryltransferase